MTSRTMAMVFILFCVGGPYTVGWLIVASVVAAFKCQPRWAETHIGKKLLKAVLPFGTDENAIFIIRIARAPRFHIAPSSILSRKIALASAAMCRVVFNHGITLCTSTTRCMPNFEMMGLYDCCASTIAKTFPFDPLRYSKAAEH